MACILTRKLLKSWPACVCWGVHINCMARHHTDHAVWALCVSKAQKLELFSNQSNETLTLRLCIMKVISPLPFKPALFLTLRFLLKHLTIQPIIYPFGHFIFHVIQGYHLALWHLKIWLWLLWLVLLTFELIFFLRKTNPEALHLHPLLLIVCVIMSLISQEAILISLGQDSFLENSLKIPQ